MLPNNLTRVYPNARCPGAAVRTCHNLYYAMAGVAGWGSRIPVALVASSGGSGSCRTAPLAPDETKKNIGEDKCTRSQEPKLIE
jgi:hypothetical protein